ncbi:hypothetical protein [Ruegeria sp.]|uniref:hypothetical protein n=1 Tax=Ruegeria sp. TaxID=1879320 RepID=UPI0023234159|nr:hypothetical protein [Ruegeria sp.]MDA7963973.1 hypothetical protein [Ruegeria sp.]
MSQCIIPPDLDLYQKLSNAADARIVFIAGLPGTGKSLLFQQLTILADEAGRVVHTMQWDDARQAFEAPERLALYPEIDNLTHPGVRKAVGLWVRQGVQNWHAIHPDPKHLLVIELPVVGGRFIELLQPEEDVVEPLLTSDQTTVLVPVPTNALRQQIEGFRAETFANPRDAHEEKDAPPYIVNDLWLASRRLYNRWNGVPDDNARDARYDETVVRAVFERLCRFRRTELLRIDQVFPTTGSAYDRSVPIQSIRATQQEVEAAYARLATLFPGQSAEHATDGWSEY